MTGKEQVVSRFCQIEGRWGYSGTSDSLTESGKLFDWERASREQVLPDRKSSYSGTSDRIR